MDYSELIFFDLETSGLDPSQHEIIEIAAIDAVSGDSLNLRVQFNKAFASPEALEKNHYDDDSWAFSAVSQEQAYKEFQKFVTDHAKQARISQRTQRPYMVAVMAGHNIDKFDMQFIDFWRQRFGGWLPCDYSCYDTLQLARWAVPGLDRYTLESLAAKFDCATGTAHEALSDVRTNIAVAAYLLRQTGLLLPEWGRTALKNVAKERKLKIQEKALTFKLKGNEK